MVTEQRIIYVCQECFTITEKQRTCCEHDMVRIDAGTPGDERSKPLRDAQGNLKSRAPVWWVERYAWWIGDDE
ncbi:MAG: hypothetical protein MAG451_02729 [Anaerolineales bacterium]|nr:hypothetical protein [Anaerolineales bacterium]